MTGIELRRQMEAEFARSAFIVYECRVTANWAAIAIRRSSGLLARSTASWTTLMRMRENPAEITYSVNVTTKLTGASVKALLIWERRHGFPRPIRKPGRPPRYPKGQVATLRRLVGLAEEGAAMGQLIVDHLAGRPCGPEL